MIDIEAVELDEDRRPYAPAANVVAVLDRVRRVNLPESIDIDFLRIALVPEGTQGRVLQALRFLRLIDVSGRPSDRLRAMARAAEEEFRDLFAGVVREAYAPDFARIDPALDTQSRIMSAFQRYEPRSQTYRMTMLFLGLCRAAGIAVLDAPRERQMQAKQVAPRSTSAKPTTKVVGLPRGRSGIPASQVNPNLLFGVTVEDIGALPPSEFAEVWGALGKIAQARARSLKALQDMSDQAAVRQEAETEVEEGK